VEVLTGTVVELVCVLDLKADAVDVLDEQTTGFERYLMLLELPELSVQL
jgi:hypothetical protein